MAIGDEVTADEDNLHRREFTFVDHPDEWLIVTDRQDNHRYFVQLSADNEIYLESHDHETVTEAVQAAIAYILED